MKPLSLVFLLSVGVPLGATTLFSDNFESYGAGNLSGQGGWTGCGSIPVGTSGALPTKVARADLGSAGCSGAFSGFGIISHSFPGSIADNVITTLSFEAYAPAGAHDAGVWLSDLGGTTFTGMQLIPDRTVPGWSLLLYQNGNPSGRISMPGGTGVPVSFQVVIDVPGQIVYAIYNFGSGAQTTSALSLAGNTTLNQWTALSIAGDYRDGLPQDQIDNITLTQTPEPSTLFLTAIIGLLVFPAVRRRRSVHIVHHRVGCPAYSISDVLNL